MFLMYSLQKISGPQKITKINDITWLKMQYQCNLIPQLSRVFACFEVKIYPDNYSLKVIST